MTIFDNIWNKRKKGLKPGNLTTLSGESKINLSPVDTTEYLKDIFNERKHGEYVGGTLSFEGPGDNILLKTVGEGLSEEENFWIAMNYVKHKSQLSHHYGEALEIITSRDDMIIEVAKLILARGKK